MFPSGIALLMEEEPDPRMQEHEPSAMGKNKKAFNGRDGAIFGAFYFLIIDKLIITCSFRNIMKNYHLVVGINNRRQI